MYSSNVFEEVQNSLNIIEAISYYGIELKKCGNSYKSLCPFHNENTPSFTVFSKTNTYKCFGCNKGGNIINFVATLFNISNFEALKKINIDFNLKLNIGKPQNSILIDKTRKDRKLLCSFEKDANVAFIALAEYNRALTYEYSNIKITNEFSENIDSYFNLLKEQQYVESLINILLDCNLNEYNPIYMAPIKLAIDYFRRKEQKINEQNRMFRRIKKS